MLVTSPPSFLMFIVIIASSILVSLGIWMVVQLIKDPKYFSRTCVRVLDYGVSKNKQLLYMVIASSLFSDEVNIYLSISPREDSDQYIKFDHVKSWIPDDTNHVFRVYYNSDKQLYVVISNLEKNLLNQLTHMYYLNQLAKQLNAPSHQFILLEDYLEQVVFN